IVGATTYGPAPTRGRNPGLFHYGIHAAEVLFALMGDGCQEVNCLREGGQPGSDELGAEVVNGRWRAGRVGSMRGIRSGHRAFGFVAFCQKQVCHVSLDVQFIYRELLKRVMRFFATGEPPVRPEETLRIIAFIEAARASADEVAKQLL